MVRPTSSPPPVIAILQASTAEMGGVERHVLTLVRHRLSTGYGFVVAAPPRFARSAASHGVRALEWEAGAAWDLRAAYRLAHLLRQIRVTLIHSQDPRAGVIGRLLARQLRLPVVCTVHVPAYASVAGAGAELKRPFYRLVERMLNWHLTDRVIYVSERVRREAVTLGLVPPERAVVVPNGIDPNRFRRNVDRTAVRAAQGTPASTVVVITVGRLTHQKGLDVLLEAVRLISPGDDQCDVWVVGDGPLRQRLELQATRLGLSKRVRFLGARDDVPDLLAAADVFALPSRFEGLPIALLEAHAAGLPCVVTDVGGNAEVVEDGVTGWLVRPEDAAGLAAQLAFLVRDSDLRRRMGQAGRMRVQGYDEDRMVRGTLEVYETVLGCAKAGRFRDGNATVRFRRPWMDHPPG